ncbi:MAG: helix-turn-helix transcriptional regulator [Patescibacteria group bacterium]|nr:MAG: helix-turn-helix transcriptional regulator [Patescibacteria group bacterium]
MPVHIINRLRELRAEHAMTQETLAEDVGVSRQTIIAIEKGQYTPSLLLAMKIASRFRKRVEDIFALK